MLTRFFTSNIIHRDFYQRIKENDRNIPIITVLWHELLFYISPSSKKETIKHQLTIQCRLLKQMPFFHRHDKKSLRGLSFGQQEESDSHYNS